MPPDHCGRALQAAGGSTLTTPRCFVQATPRVQQYLLRAGVVSALDLAGWWCSLEEVRAHGVSLGWDVADLQGAQVAWSESRRPEVRSLPNVPVPGELGLQPTAVRLSQGTTLQVSLDSLQHVEPAPPLEAGELKVALRDFFFKLGPQGAL